jgi:hypothetical protein
MKKPFIIIFTVFFTQVTSGQSMGEFMKMWNSEVVCVGDREKDKIDSEIKGLNPVEKKLLSSQYSNGTLTIYRQNKAIRKLVKTYTRSETTITESYYFHGRWPLYVEISHSKQKSLDKFYFDKTNLMLWIDTNQNEYTVENDKCSQRWRKLNESMDKLNMAANSEKKQVSEDKIKLPEQPPMTKDDSLKMIEHKKQFEVLLKIIPDTLNK